MRNWNEITHLFLQEPLVRFYSTYEELKLNTYNTDFWNMVCFYSTYEELKLRTERFSRISLWRFYSTYEELKLPRIATISRYI